VTIYVGPYRQRFVVHKDLLCKSAEFFKAAFCTNFKEGKEGTMDMPEDSPTAFSLFIEWLYHGTIPNGHSQSYVDSLYDFYILAEKICMNSPELKDNTMDKIQDVSKLYNLLPKPAMVRKVFQNTVEGSDLKTYCVLALVFYLNKQREDRQEVVLSKNSFMDIVKQELDALFELCKDDKELFKIFAWLLHVRKNPERAVDPRLRDDSNPDNRCYFHCHWHRYGQACNKDKTQAFLVPDFVTD
jgi:BTB/POZ domain